VLLSVAPAAGELTERKDFAQIARQAQTVADNLPFCAADTQWAAYAKQLLVAGAHVLTLFTGQYLARFPGQGTGRKRRSCHGHFKIEFNLHRGRAVEQQTIRKMLCSGFRGQPSK